MPQWQGKSKGNRTGYGIFIYILRKWGVKPAYKLLRFVSFYYVLFSAKSTKPLWYYLRKRMGFGLLKSIHLLIRNYYLFGQTIIDRIVFMSGIPNKFTFDFDGEEHLHRIAENGKGGLLLSAHIGNWEIAGYLLKRLQTRIHIVMYDGEHQKLKEYLSKVQGEHTANIIVIKNDLSHIYAINDALSKNELVCMHADRFVDGNKTVSREFLGKVALFPAGPFVLAAKLKVPVFFVFALKESNLHYHFFSTEGKTYTGDDKNEIPGRILNEFVDAMEEKVKAYPEQWYNYFDFWRKEKD